MPVCELCGKNELVKQDGMFVCQGCGTKYTLEEARKLVGATENVGDEKGSPLPVVVGGVVGAIAALVEGLLVSGDFQSGENSVQADNPREVNNYIAQGWSRVVDEYKQLEHPTKLDLDKVVVRAKECLAALDNAALLEPDKYVQNTLIYNNCIEIVDSVVDLDCYEQVDGEWKTVWSPMRRDDLKLSGQKDSWEDKRDAHEASIRAEYIDAHPEEVSQRESLVVQEAQTQAQLDELKAEKKSKGFFNFSEKAEVKERMAPVKEQLRVIQDQIDDLDENVDDYVEERLGDLADSYVQLRF